MTEGKSIQLMSEEDLFEEIQTNLLELISESDFVLEFKLRLLSLPLSDRREFVNTILDALKNNNQSVGTFMVSNKGKKMPPTVSNWLKDFYQSIGENLDSEKKEEYLNSPEFKKIELGPRTVLQNLFEFYELIKAYQKDPDKIEKMMVRDEKGELHIMDKGELYDLDEKSASSDEKISEVASERKITQEEMEERKLESEEIPEKKEKSAKGGSPPAMPMHWRAGASDGKENDKLEETSNSKVAKRDKEKPKEKENQTKTEKPGKPLATSYMYPEDEEEIRKHKNNLSSFSLPEISGAASVIQKIIEENNLSFPDDNLKKRFNSICSSFLKGIRNEKKTKELFIRSTKVGGLDYSENTAERIITSLKENKSQAFQQPPKDKSAKDRFVAKSEKEAKQKPPTPREALEKAMADKKVIKSKEEVKQEKSEAEIAKDIKSAVKKEESKEREEEKKEPLQREPQELKKEPNKIEFKEEKKSQKRNPISVSRPASVRGKKKIEDIKSKKKLQGPVDELRDINLLDFSRLGSEKVSAVEKIYEKLNLLKEDSFSKYSKGVKAWRDSEVYKLYLDMGRSSMESQKTIREIIQERKKNDQPYLSEKQFNEIVDLNKKLSFSL